MRFFWIVLALCFAKVAYVLSRAHVAALSRLRACAGSDATVPPAWLLERYQDVRPEQDRGRTPAAAAVHHATTDVVAAAANTAAMTDHIRQAMRLQRDGTVPSAAVLHEHAQQVVAWGAQLHRLIKLYYPTK